MILKELEIRKKEKRYYYAAYSTVMAGTLSMPQDGISVNAQSKYEAAMKNKAVALSKDNSEIYCVIKNTFAASSWSNPMAVYERCNRIGSRKNT